MATIMCDCGKEKASLRKKLCDECRINNKREKARKDARIHRAKHGSKVNRGEHCSMCRGVKEHRERGYCLACERIRYLTRSKPDCSKCGKLKDNPRDSYCNDCKNEKARARSLIEGRRYKHPSGLKPTCSNCGRDKEDNYKKDAYCRSCRLLKRKLRKPFMSDEQKFKEASRRLTRLAIKRGVLIKQPCEVCGEVNVDAHHDDYEKPLEIRWLCKNHHREYHNSLKHKGD